MLPWPPMQRYYAVLFLCLGLLVEAGAHGPMVSFVENKGQWPAQVLYRAQVPGGAVFVEREALTIVQFSGLDLHAHGQASVTSNSPKGHAYRVHFVSGSANDHEGRSTQPHYENHFVGNDPARWGSGCAVHGEVWLREVWPGIDLRLDGSHGLKYELVVAPGADPAQAVFRYEGQDGLRLKGGELHVALSTGLVVEEAPLVYHEGALGEQRTVEARYALRGDELRFLLPKGHDPAHTLVIDPVLTFSSFSGSTADNFGFTATYDEAGHTYGGGIVFNAGYPVSPGAFDPTFNGGSVDVGISKWTPAGDALVWSTYLGGSESEAPHSLVVNDDDELFVMGSTGSGNFPTTPGCFQSAFQGGPTITFVQGYGFGFNNGADIFLARLNAAGTALLGATYVGGTNTDGVNTSAVAYNYGDAFRGEVALDPDGNPVVASSTASANAPVTAGAPQIGFGGGLDAYVFRLDPGLTTLLWATYHGGSGADAGHGVQFSSSGEVYITGGTNSTDLPTAGSPLQGTNAGGVDGFIARYTPAGNALLSTTHLGTPAYDQCFFVQLDVNDNVYVVGQTRGAYPVTPGVYANPGSSQFIHKLSTDLATTQWSTRVGNGIGTQDLSPAAFLVSDCGQIFFSGWAGSTNNFGSPTNSSTNGSPVTPDAYQPTTDGSDFYLMVLEPDAVGLSYATFFGGTSSEHVDGGTSRFDKDGKVYQAVCAGCGSGSYPTTPGAHATTNGNPNCNLGVFKFDLNIPIASIDIAGPNVICFPDEVQFVNNSTGGNTYLWDFGDGSTSTAFEPLHTYTEAGVFSVTMVMTDQYGCTQADTASIQITSIPTPEASVDPIGPVCPGGSVQLNASEGEQWEWFPPEGLSNTTIQDPIAAPDSNTTYFVVVTNGCGVDTASVDVVFAQPTGSVLPDASICLGDSATLGASGGASYTWSPATGLSDPGSPSPLASPSDTTTYSVTIITADGCEIVDSITVNVVFDPPQPNLTDTAICAGTSAQLFGPLADTHLWSAAPGISTLDVRDPVVQPGSSTWYVVQAGNLCGTIVDSAFVEVVQVVPQAWPDTVVCPGDPVQLQASGGSAYSWSPPTGLDDPAIEDPIAVTLDPVTYTVTVTDALGCTGSASLTIGLLPPPTVTTGPDVIIDPWDAALLTASGSVQGSYQWTPPLGLECDTCATTWASPGQTTTYTVTLTQGNGCSAKAAITVIINGSLFVPNTFTPNGDGINEEFGAFGTELASFQLWVFNRWGELIFESDDIERRWDGTYKGVASPIDTYVWKVQATELSGFRREAVGHVNLVR